MNIEKIKKHIDIIKKHTQEVHTALHLIEIETELEEASNQVQAVVMPNEVVAGDIKLMFGEDTEKYSLWCEIVNDVFMEYDTTSEGEEAQILIDKIERLLKLVSQREA